LSILWKGVKMKKQKTYVLQRKSPDINGGRWWSTAWESSSKKDALSLKDTAFPDVNEEVKVINTKTGEILWELK